MSAGEKIQKFITENQQILSEYKDLIKSAEDEIFSSYCLKNYKTECDPYCGFFIDGSCKYPSELNKFRSNLV